jgi:hypothetical protein
MGGGGTLAKREAGEFDDILAISPTGITSPEKAG